MYTHTHTQLIQNNKINLFKGGLDYKLQIYKYEVLRDDYIDKKQHLLRVPVPFCLVPAVLCDLNGFTCFQFIAAFLISVYALWN